MRACGRCEGCTRPADYEVTSRSLAILSDHAGGYIRLGAADLLRVARKAELDRWEYEARLLRWAHGGCVELTSDESTGGAA
tara:strand:+ start:229 stop:471 length:243 start_codon:yes stop_codon:yes gene_type:complete